MKLFLNDKIFTSFQFEKENDFEMEVVKNSKKFFGKNSIYIDAKKKIHTLSLGNSITKWKSAFSSAAFSLKTPSSANQFLTFCSILIFSPCLKL